MIFKTSLILLALIIGHSTICFADDIETLVEQPDAYNDMPFDYEEILSIEEEARRAHEEARERAREISESNDKN